MTSYHALAKGLFALTPVPMDAPGSLSVHTWLTCTLRAPIPKFQHQRAPAFSIESGGVGGLVYFEIYNSLRNWRVLSKRIPEVYVGTDIGLG